MRRHGFGLIGSVGGGGGVEFVVGEAGEGAIAGGGGGVGHGADEGEFLGETWPPESERVEATMRHLLSARRRVTPERFVFGVGIGGKFFHIEDGRVAGDFDVGGAGLARGIVDVFFEGTVDEGFAGGGTEMGFQSVL